MPAKVSRMHRRLMFSLACLLGPAPWCHAEAMATLFTDPVVQIKAIDGDSTRKVLVFESKPDRGTKLTPGNHVLDVCYYRFTAVGAGGYLSQSYTNCDADRKVPFDAQPGHIYRLKLELLPGEWKTWIEDVTAEEAELLAQVAAPKAKGGGKSLLVLRVSPGNMGVMTTSGRTEHIWFLPGSFGGFLMKGDPADGLLTRKVSGGSTVGITDLSTPKAALIPIKTEFLCGDSRIPVLENVPGGGAFYLGEFEFTSTPAGPRVRVKHEGLEAARETLRKTLPEFADKLQHAQLQWKRLPEVCAVDPRQVVRIEPGSPAPNAN
jgi:hypothetical protein